MKCFPTNLHRLLVVLASFLVFLAACDRKESERSIKIAGMTWAGVGPAFVASEKGYFSPYNVEMLILDDSRARQAAFSAGDADIFITTIDQHAREVENGIPGKITWLSDISHGADGIVARPGIETIAELREAKIGLTLGTAAEYMLSKALSDNGVESGDVELIEVDDQAAIAAAFESGALDAAVVWEPLLTEIATSSGGKVLATSADIPDSIIGVFVSSEEFYEDRDLMGALLDGWFRALGDINDDPVGASEIMANGFGVSASEIETMISGLKFADKSVNQSYLCNDEKGQSSLELLVIDTSEYWISTGRQDAVPNPSDRINKTSVDYFCSSQE